MTSPREKKPDDSSRDKPVDWISVGVGFVIMIVLLVSAVVLWFNPDRHKEHDPKIKVKVEQNIQLRVGQSHTFRPKLLRKNLLRKGWRARPFDPKRYEVEIKSLQKKTNTGFTVHKRTLTAKRPGEYKVWLSVKSIPGVTRYRVHRSIPIKLMVKP